MSSPDPTIRSNEQALPTPPEALRKALIVVVLTSLAVYGTIGAMLFKGGWRGDLWDLFFIFLFTVAIATPAVYLSFRQRKDRKRSRRSYFIAGTLYLFATLLFAGLAAFYRERPADRFFEVTWAAFCAVTSANNFRGAFKNESITSPR